MMMMANAIVFISRRMVRPSTLLRGFASASAATNKPYGRPTTYRQSIWQGTPPPEPVKAEEFWPQEAMMFKPKMGMSSKKGHRKIMVAVGTPDWAGSVTALHTAFQLSNKDDEIIVFTAPKTLPDSQPDERMKEGLKMAALIRNVQAIAKQYNRPLPHIEMPPSSPQPKIEVVKKIAMDNVDLVICGNGRYPWNAMGNVASYVVLNAPCDVLVVKGGAEDH